ncbi:MAG: type II toxin-antitoxin system VapC family toxin [Thermoleophilia bacterium]|nr:type II toxin-antitoxin system VapC family toxin [Thermoleophilia bacterium]
MPKVDAPASVIDPSALLALLQDGNGADEVVEAIAAGAAISTVNLSEVLAKLAEHGQPAAVAVGAIHEATEGALRIEPFTEEDAAEWADLRPRSKAQGLSSGDRACLALAARLEVPAATADRDWRNLPEVGVAVKLIR